MAEEKTVLAALQAQTEVMEKVVDLADQSAALLSAIRELLIRAVTALEARQGA